MHMTLCFLSTPLRKVKKKKQNKLIVFRKFLNHSTTYLYLSRTNNTAVEILPYTCIHLSHIQFHHFHRRHLRKFFHNRLPCPFGDSRNQ